MAEKIKEGLYWIGVNNPESKDFHGIPTPRGGSYNSYLIKDKKTTLIDATNTPFFEEYVESLKSVTNLEDVDYIIVNHTENDHAGALAELLKFCRNATIVCNEVCEDFLRCNFSINAKFITFNDSLELDIGNRSLKLIQTPMVHWPETMVTYDPLNEALFSGDLFGAEISHESLFADEMENYGKEIDNYYALIMRPFKDSVNLAIKKIRPLNLSLVCPSHGPVYRDDVNGIIDYYEKLSSNPENDSKVLIIYDTIWHSTEMMAKIIAESVRIEGKIPVLRNLAKDNSVEILAEALTARSIAFGSLTIMGNYHPSFETLFSLLKLLRQEEKKCVVFGSFGWASMAVPKMKNRLLELKYTVLDSFECRFKPKDDQSIHRLAELGKKLCE